MVVVATGGAGTRAVRTEYPYEEGTTLGTTKIEGKTTNLVAEVDKVTEDEVLL